MTPEIATILVSAGILGCVICCGFYEILTAIITKAEEIKQEIRRNSR